MCDLPCIVLKIASDSGRLELARYAGSRCSDFTVLDWAGRELTATSSTLPSRTLAAWLVCVRLSRSTISGASASFLYAERLLRYECHHACSAKSGQ